MWNIPFLRRPRFAAAFLLFLGLFLFAHTTERTLRSGSLLVFLGAALRFWADGYVGHRKVNWTPKPSTGSKIGYLVTAGPYAFIRHPLYFGTLLIGLGFCIIVGRIWLTTALILSFLLVYRKQMTQEETVLHHEWGEEFRRYQAAVPRWFPTWKRYSHPQGEWSWQGIRASKEWKTAFWVVAGLIAFYLREELIQEKDFFVKRGVEHIVWLTLLLALILGMGWLEVRKRLQ